MNAAEPAQITRRTAAGAGLLVMTRLSTRLIDLITLMLLARLLTPADFGLVAIAMTLVLICEAISDLPIAQAVVRLPSLAPYHLDTAFTISALRGVAVAGLLCIVAWPFAILYSDTRLVGLICMLGLAPACRGICNPNFALFARQLDFRREMFVEIVAKLVSLMVAATTAWLTGSYWAIALGTIAGPVTMNAVAYLIAPWRPRFTLRGWPAFSRFLGWSSSGQVLNAISWQIDQLALGRFVARTALGYFTIASMLAFLPFQVVIAQIARPFVSGLAMLQAEPKRLAAGYLLGASTLAAFCVPVMVGMSVLAGPIVALALGPKWDGAATVLGWLALITIPSLFVAPAGPLAMALDRTDLGFRLSCVEFLLRLPLTCIAAAEAGIPGVLVARAAATAATTLYGMVLVKRMIGVDVAAQFHVFRRCLVSSLVMAAGLWLVGGGMTHPGSPVALAFQLAASIVWGAGIYVASMMVLWWVAGCPEGAETKLLGILNAASAPIARLLIKRRRRRSV